MTPYSKGFAGEHHEIPRTGAQPGQRQVLCVYRQIAEKATAEETLQQPSVHLVKVVSYRVRSVDFLRATLDRNLRKESHLRDVVHCYGQRHDCTKVCESRKGNLWRPVQKISPGCTEIVHTL